MNRVDFDFPCSRLFRSYEAQQNGEHLPPLGDIRLPEEIASEEFWAKYERRPSELSEVTDEDIEKLYKKVDMLFGIVHAFQPQQRKEMAIPLKYQGEVL